MSEWISVAEIFGENVFNDAVMQEEDLQRAEKDDRRR